MSFSHINPAEPSLWFTNLQQDWGNRNPGQEIASVVEQVNAKRQAIEESQRQQDLFTKQLAPATDELSAPQAQQPPAGPEVAPTTGQTEAEIPVPEAPQEAPDAAGAKQTAGPSAPVTQEPDPGPPAETAFAPLPPIPPPTALVPGLAMAPSPGMPVSGTMAP